MALGPKEEDRRGALELRGALCERLAARRSEIERHLLTRVHSIADPTEVADTTYVEGVRSSVNVALDYGLEAIASDGDRVAPVPDALRAQARLAARNGVGLDTVTRRYTAGYVLLTDFLFEAALERRSLASPTLRQVLRRQAVILDRVLATVGEEYLREADRRPETTAQRKAALVRRLLAGELVATSELSYPFDSHHVGVVLSGADPKEALSAVAGRLDSRLLAVEVGEGACWAWFGARRPLDPDRVAALASEALPTGAGLAIGEPGNGLDGWRLTHRQAVAAHPICLRKGLKDLRYAKVAMLASALRDDLLATSLLSTYLAPLEDERDGGKKLRQTLRAHFATDRCIASTASALRVSRNTVMSRLNTSEERIGRTLQSCAAELKTALELQELSHCGTRSAEN